MSPNFSKLLNKLHLLDNDESKQKTKEAYFYIGLQY